MYIPEEAIDLAMNLGYTVTLSPKTGASLERAHRRIWQIRDGWQTADNTGTKFINHQKFDSVIDALRRPV